MDTTVQESGITPVQLCIYCATKHIGLAMSLMSTCDGAGAIVGELELARRHLMPGCLDIARAIGEVIQSIMINNHADGDRLAAIKTAVLDKVNKIKEIKENTDSRFGLESTEVSNPFVAAVHVYAAYRLAFELGYMDDNKFMILGELALASEHFYKDNYELAMQLRDARHRIELKRASDIDVYWPHLINTVSQHIDQNLTAYTAEYADGLAKWLGIDNGQDTAVK